MTKVTCPLRATNGLRVKGRMVCLRRFLNQAVLRRFGRYTENFQSGEIACVGETLTDLHKFARRKRLLYTVRKHLPFGGFYRGPDDEAYHPDVLRDDEKPLFIKPKSRRRQKARRK